MGEHSEMKPSGENVKCLYFTKSESGVIKGVALIMMFVHHFLTFPEWYPAGISYPVLQRLAPYIRGPLRLCVAVFCFLSGCVYYHRPDKTFRYSLRKIRNILISYWCVFLPFALIAAFFADYSYTAAGFIEELFALYRPTMCFCWYVPFYGAFMLLLPLTVKLLRRGALWDTFVCFLVVPMALTLAERFVRNGMVREVFDSLISFYPCVLAGCLFARFGVFQRLEAFNRKIVRRDGLNGILWAAVLMIVPFGRWVEPSVTVMFKELPLVHFAPSVTVNLDAVYAPLFLCALVRLHRIIDCRWLTAGLAAIGRHSLSMWFVSCIFFGNCQAIFKHVLYLPRNPVLVVLWGLGLCYAVSLAVDSVAGRLIGAADRLSAR